MFTKKKLNKLSKIQRCTCAQAHQNPPNITYPSDSLSATYVTIAWFLATLSLPCQAQYLLEIPTILGCILAAQLFLCLIFMRKNRSAVFLLIKSFKYIFTLIPSKIQGEIACFLKRGVLFGRYYPYNLVFRALDCTYSTSRGCVVV